jgi:hypothetical protein
LLATAMMRIAARLLGEGMLDERALHEPGAATRCTSSKLNRQAAP